MTDRLYYNDSYLREFDARVLSCSAAPEAGRRHVTLDRSAFYPTSGGQPFDTGKLGHTNVLDVFDGEGEQVVHVIDGSVNAGESAHGTVDWLRRFDHMQQHTGQHILSAAFVELFNFPTVSFHLGRETCTIDLPQTPNPTQLEEAERRANEIVFANRDVEVIYGTAEELASLGVRKAVEREGILRAVAIRDFDRQPCGGTHVAHTGEVGLILLRKIEKQKQNCRIEFACGARALRIARADYATLIDAARLLTCGPAEVTASVQRSLDERLTAQKRQQMLVASLARYQAEALLSAALDPPPGQPRRIVKLFDDADAAYLRMLATQLVAQPNTQAFLATRAGGHVVFAQSSGLTSDMNQLLRSALQSDGGKGGGSRDFSQGAAADSSKLEGVLAAAAAQ